VDDQLSERVEAAGGRQPVAGGEVNRTRGVKKGEKSFSIADWVNKESLKTPRKTSIKKTLRGRPQI